MSEEKSTKLTIRDDKAASISSSAHGANINAIGFNVLFIALRNPKLAVEVMKLYAKARKIKADDPKAPDEDFAMFAEEVTKTLRDQSEG
jgi:hypothetical protein